MIFILVPPLFFRARVTSVEYNKVLFHPCFPAFSTAAFKSTTNVKSLPHDKVFAAITDLSPCLKRLMFSHALFDPDLPVTIVLVDANRQIEVYLKSDEEDCDILPEICSKVIETVFGAIHKVFDVMRLTEIEISPAVLCPCQDKSVAHSACHYTAFKRDYLRCSKTGGSVGKAQAQHMMWLNATPKKQASTSSMFIIY